MRNLVRLYEHLAAAASTAANATAKAVTAKPPMSSHTKKVIAIVLLSVAASVLLTLTIWFYVKRKRAYEDYNKRPQTFIRKPSDSQIQRIDESEETFIREEHYNRASKETSITKKNLAEGTVYEVVFRPAGGNEWCSVSFTRLLEETCYFEVELLSTKGEVMIGYGWAPDVERRFDRKKDIGSVAVGFSSLGRVKNNGILVENYEKPGNYGDCIGIGITKEDMRVWFTYNGVLLNEPTSAEQERWFRQNVEQQLEKDKKTRRARSFLDKLLGRRSKRQKNNAIISKAELAPRKRKDDVSLQRQKVALHDSTFAYCAYISCITDQECPILVNVGGQTFRFPQHDFKEGLYKEKEESSSEEPEEEDPRS